MYIWSQSARMDVGLGPGPSQARVTMAGPTHKQTYSTRKRFWKTKYRYLINNCVRPMKTWGQTQTQTQTQTQYLTCPYAPKQVWIATRTAWPCQPVCLVFSVIWHHNRCMALGCIWDCRSFLEGSFGCISQETALKQWPGLPNSRIHTGTNWVALNGRLFGESC